MSLLNSLDRLDIAAAELDGQGRLCACTSAFGRVLGLAATALTGRTVEQLFEAAGFARVQSGGQGIFRRDAGGVASFFRLERKDVGGSVVVTMSDVSAGFRACEGLRAFYSVRDRLLLDGKIGTWSYDPDAETYHFSSELSLGHEGSAAPVPVSMLQLIQHEDDRDRDSEIRDRITREGGTAEAEMRYREADGTWTHLQVHYRAGQKTASGKYEMFGVSQNITPVAIARDIANGVSQRLRFALRSAKAGVFEYNYLDRSFRVSEELAELLGAETLNGIGADALALFAPDDRERARGFFAGAAAAHAPIDVRIAQARGMRWMRFYFDVIKRNLDGTPAWGVGLLLDIDEQKHQEIALAEAQRTADFANRTKTEFLANMSHELRTPLNAILGFSEVMAQQIFGPLGAKYVDYAQDIHKSGSHLLELVNDVLDLSKLEAGKLELHEAELDVSRLAEDCIGLVKNRANAGRVHLRAEFPPSLPLLRADERVTRQLLLNFLSNAVKFTPEGGTVVVRASRDRADRFCLAVSDTGIGMTPAEIKVALSPFGQIDSRLARKSEGTGLGLPICKSLMDLHGGELLVESHPGKGTTVTARFPGVRTVSRAPRAAAS